MRGDYSIGERSTGLLRATELSEGHEAISQLPHAAPHCPRRGLRAGVDWLFARVFEWLFEWPVAIKSAENPAIPNAAPPAGFASCRHLYVAPMSERESRSRDSGLAHDRAPHAPRTRSRLRAGFAAPSPRTAALALARGLSVRRKPGTGRGWIGVARASSVMSSVRSPVRSPRPSAEGRVSRSAARFARFAFCRHPYVTQRSVHEFAAP